MKKAITILGLICAIIAVIISVTPLYNLAFAPIIIAFLSGLFLIYLSKNESSKPKTIQYIFLLVIISLSLTIYKGVVNTAELGDTEQLEQRDEENLEDSKEILEDLEIDEDF